MTGLLFKELRQNRRMFPAAILLPILAAFLPIPVQLSFDHTAKDVIPSLNEDGLMTRLIMLFTAAALLSQCIRIALGQDESKNWAYFTISHPKGYRAQIYMKYVLIFMLLGLFFVSAYYSDMLLQMLFWHSTGEELISFLNLLPFLFFFQLLMQAFSIPFIFRFGSKNGSNMLAVFLLILVLAAVIFLLFGPDGGYGALVDAAEELLIRLGNGELNGALAVIAGAFPLAAAAAYIGSYFLLCRFYLKGAAEYVK